MDGQGRPHSAEFQLRFLPSGRTVQVGSGSTLLNAALWAGIPVASTCGGYGSCMECRIRILEGKVPATAADRQALSDSQIAEGWRLACGVVVHEDLTCFVPPPASQPRAAVEGLQRVIHVEPVLRVESSDQSVRILHGARVIHEGKDPPAESPLGLAVDLGTTTVAGTLVELSTGQLLASGSRVNEQVTTGADVITRAAKAHSEADGVRTLQGLALDTLNGLARTLCREAGVDPESIYEGVVTGNAIMLHLLLGVDPHPLAVAPFQPLFTKAQDVAAAKLCLAPEPGADADPPLNGSTPSLGFNPAARVVTFPLIGAYAGGDTVAGLHATGLLRGDSPALLIDIGTNTEVAVGWGGRAVVASAPAGPAFEGGGILHGCPAVPGAIARLRLGLDSGEVTELDVIGGVSPTGICGSGLVDALAGLRRVGLLDNTGRLASKESHPHHPLAHLLTTRDGRPAFQVTEDIHLSQGDIRELQAAIAAVAAATRIILEEVKIRPHELGAVYLAGSFGTALNPKSARTVGLVPQLPLDRIRNVGNVAMEGAGAALISFREREAAFQIPGRADYVELSGHLSFNDAFLAGMEFPEAD